MARRTEIEIERDYRRIKNVVDTTFVTSIKEIARATKLSDSEVRTSLARHPIIEKRILTQLAKNKEELVKEGNLEKHILKMRQEAGLSSKSDISLKLKVVKTENERREVHNEVTTDSEKAYVIDASIMGVNDIEKKLSDICQKEAKIILTSVTIKELEKMQKFKDSQAVAARHVLAMAAERLESFHAVLIDENLETPDDCIIKYCAENKHKVTLYTSDKAMALKARMYGVETEYFKREPIMVNAIVSIARPSEDTTTSTDATSQNFKEQDKESHTLYPARKEGDKLCITDFHNEHRSILVHSDGIDYTEGVYELKIGDDVFLATKKFDYMTFAHYQITSLSETDNCSLVFSRRIYDQSGIDELPKAGYKSFMREFKSKHNL